MIYQWPISGISSTFPGAIILSLILSCGKSNHNNDSLPTSPPRQVKKSNIKYSIAIKDVWPGPGFPNLGSTCFANAALRLLFEVPDIKIKLSADRKTHYFRENNEKKTEKTRIKFLNAARKLFKNYSLADKKAVDISPNLLKLFRRMEDFNRSEHDSPKIGGSDGAQLGIDQGDSAEFIGDFLNAMKVSPLPWGMHLMAKDSPDFYKFVPDFDRMIRFVVPQNARILADNGFPDVKKLIQRYTRPQDFTGDNRIKDNSEKLRNAVGYLGLQKPVDWVILNLARIRLNLETMNQEKLETWIEPSTNIELPLINSAAKGALRFIKMNLKAITVHQGSDPQSGHYYTYIGIYGTGKKIHHWVKFDDHKVSLTPEEMVFKDAAKNGCQYLYIKA